MMNRLIQSLSATILSVGIAHAASPLAGTWMLTAADTLYADGHRAHGFGDHPEGRMIVDAQGRYMIEIYQVDGTPHYSVHYGRVMLDPAAHHVVFDVERSADSSWVGKRQVRDYKLMGDHLSYQVPASATGDKTIAISEWTRAAE
ncbi:lipocalin-like domain-containing protein [Tanticharoenia sakaeratensis]|jgi:hypothetical protein|uniref:Uncharacterized protein n=1 Tax=Tanticharoenia sakaeratensis NBRC 103193 TaxID=1231623 RepID=A0A0D6MQM8_9PROT|nr:lipocalin-like domain-containing protein [Tanticharoenia sakaeratensis]GAN55710.1 hypothetical protein Tasa_056_023 [Tanticharoenia sakaeratensis NBRC 103193]